MICMISDTVPAITDCGIRSSWFWNYIFIILCAAEILKNLRIIKKLSAWLSSFDDTVHTDSLFYEFILRDSLQSDMPDCLFLRMLLHIRTLWFLRSIPEVCRDKVRWMRIRLLYIDHLHRYQRNRCNCLSTAMCYPQCRRHTSIHHANSHGGKYHVLPNTGRDLYSSG